MYSNTIISHKRNDVNKGERVCKFGTRSVKLSLILREKVGRPKVNNESVWQDVNVKH